MYNKLNILSYLYIYGGLNNRLNRTYCYNCISSINICNSHLYVLSLL